MDLQHLSYEFLDLTNIDERERLYLLQSLCESDTGEYLQLPWHLKTNGCDRKKDNRKLYNQNGPVNLQYDIVPPVVQNAAFIPNNYSSNQQHHVVPSHPPPSRPPPTQDISTLELHYMLMNGVQNHYEHQPQAKPQVPLNPTQANVVTIPTTQIIPNMNNNSIIQDAKVTANPSVHIVQHSPIINNINNNNAEVASVLPAPLVQNAVLNVPQQEAVVIQDHQVIDNEEQHQVALKQEKPEQSPPPQNKSWASLFGKPRSATKEPLSGADANAAANNADKTLNSSGADGVGDGAILAKNRRNDNDVRLLEDPFSYRLGEFLYAYEQDFRTFSLLPRGLTNRNNYCYINSILQALISCSPFYNLMSAIPSRPSNSGKSLTPIIDSMITLMKECQPISQNARVTRKEKNHRRGEESDLNCGLAFEPTWIYKMIGGSLADTFKVDGSQEDAEEFLGCLLNGLNDEMIKVKKLVHLDSATNINGVDASAKLSYIDGDKEDNWKVMGPKNKGSITRRTEAMSTPLSDIFRGQLRSRVHRSGGSESSCTDNVQPFLTLPINIEKASNVEEALENVFKKTKLDGVICSKTKQEIEASQQVSIEELPVVLVLHLKCFDYKMDGCSKIIKALDFPIDLKIDVKLLGPNHKKYSVKQRQYKLFAVVYHDGKEASKGHYLTDIYHVGYSRWVRFDDASVKAVTEAQALKPQGSRVPYLLFYRRCDTINSQVNNSNTSGSNNNNNSFSSGGVNTGSSPAAAPANAGAKDERRKSNRM